jgi:NTE family protein
VLRVLDREGILPDVIAGCSIGAVVGGCYAAGKLDAIETFARTLTKRRIMGLLDFHIGSSGLIAGDRLKRLLERDLAGERIEDLSVRFGAVATELGTGHEIWISKGVLVDALCASYALPGVFDPVKLGGRWLMDGALVNPVPVTVARAFGADVVICVNLNGEVRLRGGTVIQGHESDEMVAAVEEQALPRSFFRPFTRGTRTSSRPPGAPGVAGVMIDAFNITQDRISRSRLAGDPPDLIISPKTGSLGLFEFHRAAECIELGATATERALPEIRELLANGLSGRTTGQAVAM